jgi:hypothetical protein
MVAAAGAAVAADRPLRERRVTETVAAIRREVVEIMYFIV